MQSDTPDRLKLLNQVECLTARVHELEALLLGEHDASPVAWHLTQQEATVFALLMRREVMSRSAAMTVLYAGRSGDEPDEKIIDVYIHRLRHKLPVTLRTAYMRGWYLTAEDKATLRALCRQQPERVAA